MSSVELVEVVRSGYRECVHRGSVLILRPDGSELLALGTVDSPIYPRSTNKPMQALALLRTGFQPTDSTELAIATASHYGEPDHVRLVERILQRHGLSEEQLRCPPDLPTTDTARAMALHNGGARRTYMNCSGKHAAMLASCLANGWPTETYLEPTHPLQQVVLDTIREVTGQPPSPIGTDGCGLPIAPVSLRGLARAFGTLISAPAGSNERRTAEAIREHPYLISGSDAPDLRLMTAVPGLVCKIGADGVHAGALPDGTVFAYKIDDGHDRARLPLTAAVLRRAGATWTPELAALAAIPVLGGGIPVGSIHAIPGVF